MSGLDALANAVFTRLELVSHVKAAALDAPTSHLKPGSREPAGSPAPHLYYRREYDRARTDTRRRELIRGALDELWSARHSRRSPVDCQTLEGRLKVGRDTRPVKDVAREYGYTVKHVYRLRALARQHDALEGVAVRPSGVYRST